MENILNVKEVSQISGLAYVTLNLGGDYTVITTKGCGMMDLLRFQEEIRSTNIPKEYRGCLIDVSLRDAIKRGLEPEITLEEHNLTDSLFAATMVQMVVLYNEEPVVHVQHHYEEEAEEECLLICN